VDELLVSAEERASRGAARGPDQVLVAARARATRLRRQRRSALFAVLALVASLVIAALVDRDPPDRPRTIDSFASDEAATARTLPPQAPCPPPRFPLGNNGLGDYIDFVRVANINYVKWSFHPSNVAREILGPQVATVCESYRVRLPDSSVRNGDASYLDEGAPIFSVKGYDPTFRLAAERNGQIVIFEADTSPLAKVGRDLVDFSKVRVTGIAITNWMSTDVSARIDDPAVIARLVSQLHKAPVDQEWTIPGTEATCVLEFELEDGTTTRRTLWLDDGMLLRGIEVGREFVDIVRAAVR
jgi:hypothetical protein